MDHVPPQSLFPKPRPSDLITVPACVQCHSRQCSQDDQYFYVMLSISEQTGDDPEARKTRESALRALRRPEAAGFRRDFLEKTGRVAVVSPSGIPRGTRLGYTVELPRLFLVVGRIVRGLYYHETNSPLPPDHEVRVSSDDTFNDLPTAELAEYRQTIIEPLALIPARVIGNGVFRYRFANVENQGVTISVWGLTFYGGISFLAITGPESMRVA
jgi:hypothetical protein